MCVCHGVCVCGGRGWEEGLGRGLGKRGWRGVGEGLGKGWGGVGEGMKGVGEGLGKGWGGLGFLDFKDPI